MKLFSVGSTPVKINPLLIPVLPAAFVFGMGAQAALAFLSLAVHEAAHALFARRLGIPVLEIRAEPFGFAARMDTAGHDPYDLAAVYAAGPVASLVTAASAALFADVTPAFAPAAEALVQFNLLIACMNLLPALPLDGGRLVLAAFSGRPAKRIHAMLKAAGIALGAAFTALFVLLLLHGSVNPTLAVMGVFLIISAVAERLPPEPALISARVLAPALTLPVRQTALEEHTPLCEALRLIPAGGYRVVTVLDASMRRVGELDEKALVAAAKALGPSSELSQAVAKYGQKVL